MHIYPHTWTEPFSCPPAYCFSHNCHWLGVESFWNQAHATPGNLHRYFQASVEFRQLEKKKKKKSCALILTCLICNLNHQTMWDFGDTHRLFWQLVDERTLSVVLFFYLSFYLLFIWHIQTEGLWFDSWSGIVICGVSLLSLVVSCLAIFRTENRSTNISHSHTSTSTHVRLMAPPLFLPIVIYSRQNLLVWHYFCPQEIL